MRCEISGRTIDGQTFARIISGGAAVLAENASIVNDLNVFPIPDGDTGSNMSLTIGGGLQCLTDNSENSLGKTASALADGMLLSARGNSGVILSRLFAGIAEGLRGKDTADVSELAAALKKGVKSAYDAVINPTEGTILTVAREAADYAAAKITPESSFESFGNDYITELKASLKRTPELLPTLREAGVIDSGGAGLYYIVEGAIRSFRGESLTAAPINDPAKSLVDFSGFDENSEMKFGYCTEFLLQLQTAKVDVQKFSVDELIKWLGTIGDSIVAFQKGSVVKVHVHTMRPGEVLNHCQSFGEFLTLKIENMTLQHSEVKISDRFSSDEKPEERKKFAVVAVAAGDGIKKTFAELGADAVVDGGQSRNPSAEELTRAFESVNAENIFVLPNNSNVILTAKQAAELYKTSKVFVIGTKNVGEGYAALSMLSYDSDDAQTIHDELTEAAKGVKTGAVARAVRDSRSDGLDIKRDDYIGCADKKILSCDRDKRAAAMKLLSALSLHEHDFLIVIYGSGLSEADRGELRAALNADCPGLELYEIDGGLDAYEYTFILE